MPCKDSEKRRQYNYTYYEKHKDYYENYRLQNKEGERAKATLKRSVMKIEVLTHYGNGKCACVVCGEKRVACLSIDHINGDGEKHRKRIGIGGGSHFYAWLKHNNYPDGYQTLCMNCQWIKSSFQIGRGSFDLLVPPPLIKRGDK